jgi:hypothetical protein
LSRRVGPGRVVSGQLRSWQSGLALAALAAGALPAAPVHAQQATAEQALADARAAYGPADAKAKPACPTPVDGGEIVVCGEKEDQEQFRVKSSGALDPTGKGARGGVPRAPEVGTVYPGKVVATGCFIPPCPPPMAVIIDLKAIPEAPAGSDADRMARGLAPTGRGDPLPPPASSGESASPAAPR